MCSASTGRDDSSHVFHQPSLDGRSVEKDEPRELWFGLGPGREDDFAEEADLGADVGTRGEASGSRFQPALAQRETLAPHHRFVDASLVAKVEIERARAELGARRDRAEGRAVVALLTEDECRRVEQPGPRAVRAALFFGGLGAHRF
jgi:hypothetical protein